MLTIGSLFSGYGGLDIAIEAVLPARTAWVSDIDKGACKVLAHRYPDVPNLGDIARIDWAGVEPVDIITGGSPCQDLSAAGRRAGMTDGTRSNLWVAMREAIANVKPKFVVWENVRGAYSADAASDLEHCQGCMGSPDDRGPVLRALGRVLGDLSDLGFDAEWRGLRAADVGACHGRFRVFVLAWRRDVAHANGSGRQELGCAVADGSQHPAAECAGAETDLTLLPTPRTSDANGAGAHGSGGTDLRTAVTLLPTPIAGDAKGARNATSGRTAGSQHHGGTTLTDAMRLLPTPTAERPDGRKSEAFSVGRATWHDIIKRDTFGQYADAIARHELMIGRSAPSPTEPGRNGKPRLAARFVEWMMMLPDGWVTDVPGVTRNEALRMLGNGVVPQQAAAALRDIARLGGAA